MDQSIKQQLDQYRDAINAEFERYFEQYEQTFVSKWGEEAWGYLVDFNTRPGKRIRGALTLHAYKMFGGTDEQVGLKAALAVELIQNYLLIVDDVMDHSQMRRGKPTIHELYAASLPEAATGAERRHMANMLAINVGLIASHMANELLSSCRTDVPEHVLSAVTIFNRNIAVTGYGQIDDLYSPVALQTRDSILSTHRQKSSFYTFINPIQLGAVLAGDSSAFVSIERFGAAAGLAYQIQDDLIGLYGDPKITGKSDLDDLKEGKITLFIQQAFEKGSDEQIDAIKRVLGNESITESDAQQVRAIVDELGVKQAVVDDAYAFAKEAKEALTDETWPAHGREFLEGLMDYIVQRLR